MVRIFVFIVCSLLGCVSAQADDLIAIFGDEKITHRTLDFHPEKIFQDLRKFGKSIEESRAMVLEVEMIALQRYVTKKIVNTEFARRDLKVSQDDLREAAINLIKNTYRKFPTDEELRQQRQHFLAVEALLPILREDLGKAERAYRKKYSKVLSNEHWEEIKKGHDNINIPFPAESIPQSRVELVTQYSGMVIDDVKLAMVKNALKQDQGESVFNYDLWVVSKVAEIGLKIKKGYKLFVEPPVMPVKNLPSAGE